MIEWPFVFVSGLLGSAHCLGMCGPFALAIGSAAPAWRTNLARQLCYSAGRIFTYAVLGAAAAFVGLRMARAVEPWTNMPAILAIAAGAMLVVQGLLAAGVLDDSLSDAARDGSPNAASSEYFLLRGGRPLVLFALVASTELVDGCEARLGAMGFGFGFEFEFVLVLVLGLVAIP